MVQSDRDYTFETSEEIRKREKNFRVCLIRFAQTHRRNAGSRTLADNHVSRASEDLLAGATRANLFGIFFSHLCEISGSIITGLGIHYLFDSVHSDDGKYGWVMIVSGILITVFGIAFRETRVK